MALAIVRGPAGSGKSQYVERARGPGDLLIDYTAIYVGARLESPAGRMANTRSAKDHDPLLGIVSAIKLYAIAEASRRELGGFVTTSSSAPGEIERLRRLGADGPVVTLDPGKRRLSRRGSPNAETGESEHPQCKKAISIAGTGRPVHDGTGTDTAMTRRHTARHGARRTRLDIDATRLGLDAAGQDSTQSTGSIAHE